MVDDANCHLSCYTSTHASIWHRYGDNYDASEIMGSRPWPFGVTWRHRSCDHSTFGGRLPMGGP